MQTNSMANCDRYKRRKQWLDLRGTKVSKRPNLSFEIRVFRGFAPVQNLHTWKVTAGASVLRLSIHDPLIEFDCYSKRVYGQTVPCSGKLPRRNTVRICHRVTPFKARHKDVSVNLSVPRPFPHYPRARGFHGVVGQFVRRSFLKRVSRF